MVLTDSHEWVIWQAMRALEAAGPAFIPPPRPPIVSVMDDIVDPVRAKRTKTGRKRREGHWAQPVQVKFSRWLMDRGYCPLLLPYSRDDLARHLERQFTRGMSWLNYAGNMPFKAKKAWVVDHIVPKRLFAIEEAEKAYALTNLRPLWIGLNMRKGMVRSHLV